MPTSEVTPVTIQYICPPPTIVTLVNIMVIYGWLTSFSFHVNWPSHSWDKAISDFDREISTPGSRSWVWSKGKVIQSAQYHINSLRFHFTSIRPTIPEIELFRNIQGQGHEWGQRSRSHIVPSIQPMHYLYRKFAKRKVSNRNSPKSNQVITMTRAITLPRFIVIRWVVLTLSCRQANFC